MIPSRSHPPSQFMENWDEPVWDPKTHLNLGNPKKVVLYKDSWPEHTIPPPMHQDRSSMAYSEPFQFLSLQGIRDLRKVVDHNMKYAIDGVATNARIPLSLRGLGYRSKFIRDMNTCPVTLAFLSRIAGLKVVPSNYETSWGHTNIGAVGNDLPVDQWHIDSVPFVLVILLSDMSGAEGGKLEVVKRAPFSAAFERIHETNNNIPEQELLTVEYPSQGCAIFMQGSHMVHHVTPVKNAKERRITVVNSYQAADPRYPDDTRLGVFVNEPETCYHEYARHKAIRAKLRLDEFLLQKEWISDAKQNAKELQEISNELSSAVEVLLGLKDDSVKYIQETVKMGGYGEILGKKSKI